MLKSIEKKFEIHLFFKKCFQTLVFLPKEIEFLNELRQISTFPFLIYLNYKCLTFELKDF